MCGIISCLSPYGVEPPTHDHLSRPVSLSIRRVHHLPPMVIYLGVLLFATGALHVLGKHTTSKLLLQPSQGYQYTFTVSQYIESTDNRTKHMLFQVVLALHLWCLNRTCSKGQVLASESCSLINNLILQVFFKHPLSILALTICLFPQYQFSLH